MANSEIRDALRAAGIPQWKLAEKVGLSPNYFCTVLRHELEVQRKLELLDMIDELAAEGGRKP